MTSLAERATGGAYGMARGTETLTMAIGDFLLRRLQEAGVRHLFGVPGDFNLELLQQNEDASYLMWIGTCNELNASYAADGYARLTGIGVLTVTNAVGAMIAITGLFDSAAHKEAVARLRSLSRNAHPAPQHSMAATARSSTDRERPEKRISQSF